ncbi:MAG TPA: DNA polymerase III subunit delta' [Rhizomicrobium sp.]|nr:DNA polymerase III subunit delta' [Rhizomicrobium sp.]
MARRSSASETNDSDRIEGFAHPRERFELLGQEVVLGRAARALRAGRPPSAWLITGAPGTGKATLAYRIARYLLAHGASDAGAEDLSVPREDPASRQVMAQSHPGLLVLKRALNPKTGKLMTVLSVDEIRRLADFFGMTSGAGGWRVAIVDTADDMNDNAANALLKMLEEPPGRAMLLLLSNTPGRLLPTIRSRCQRLDLRPLDNAALEKALATELPGINAAERASLARLSGGSIGAALTLATGDGAVLAQEADRLIDQARYPDLLALLTLGEKLFRMRDGLEMFGGFLLESLSDRIRARAHDGAAGLDRWVALLGRIEQGLARATGLHLEPRQVVLTTARDLSRVARSGGL